MDNKYFDEIEAIFDEKEAKEKAIQKKEKDRKDEEEKRLQNFYFKRETVYKPLFEKVKKIVEDRGMKCSVENENAEESASQPQISITFAEKEENSSGKQYVSFAIIFDKINNQIFINENNGSVTRTKNGPVKYDVEGVTEEFLAMRLVKLIKEMVLR